MTTDEDTQAEYKMRIKKVSSRNIELLNRMAAICKKNSIELVIVVSPFYDFCDEKAMAYIRELCFKNDITLYDFSADTGYYRKKEYFYDPYHMDREGAEAFSKELATKLKIATLRAHPGSDAADRNKKGSGRLKSHRRPPQTHIFHYPTFYYSTINIFAPHWGRSL